MIIGWKSCKVAINKGNWNMRWVLMPLGQFLMALVVTLAYTTFLVGLYVLMGG